MSLTKLDLSLISGVGTSAAFNVGTAANNIVQLDSNAKIPAIDGSQLTNLNATNITGIFASTNIPNIDATKITTGLFATSAIPPITVSKFNSGTNASSSTYWRGDATWALPTGSVGTYSFLSSVATTSGASVNLNLQFQTNYDYMFVFDEVINPTQGTANLCCEYGYGTTPTYQSSGYYSVRYGGTSAGSGYSFDIGGLENTLSTNTFLMSSDANFIDGRLTLVSPATSTRPILVGDLALLKTDSNVYWQTFSVTRGVASGPISAIRFFWSNGASFSGGKIYIYTLAKS